MRTAQLEEEDRYQKALEEYRHGQYKNTDESLDALSAVEQEHKENLARIQDEYLANFNEDTLEQAGGWLQRIIDTKAAGEDLTEEQEELARNLILALDSLPDDMNEKGKKALDALGIGLDDQGNVIFTKGERLGEIVLEGEESADPEGENSYSNGKNSADGFVGGVESGFQAAFTAGYNIAKQAMAGQQTAQDSHSPAKETIKLGKDNAEGYALGIEKNAKEAAAAAKARIGIVFQYPERQLFATTVFDDVAFGPRNLGLSGDEVETRVRESLSRVGLSIDSLRDMSPFELSGGQQRRVAFAGVLAMNPEALVLDEPVAGLDPVARREFLELIAQLHKQGTTIVMVSHSMDDLAAMCDRVVVLKEGEIVRQGTPAHVFMHAAKLNEIGLGLPAPQRMAYALIDAGAPLSADEFYSIDSLASEIVSIAEGGAR